MPLIFFVLLAVAALLGWVGVGLMRRWAERHLLDVPNERSSHTRPVPRGGGAAIVAVVLGGWTVLLGPEPSWALGALLLGGALIAVVSWLDDLYTLSSAVRFGVHAVAVAVPLVAVGPWEAFLVPIAGVVPVGWIIGSVLVVVWGIGLTNAYNFMDGIDGIAAVQAIAAGGGWLAAGILLDIPLVAWTGGLLMAGAVGFMPHNWSPARIFMGDVGSAFCGFVLAMVALVAYHGAPPSLALRVPVAALLFVWPFVFDAVFTFGRRLKNGENVFAAHRSHLYQRLVIAGRSHASVSLLYGALAAVSTTAGVIWLMGVPGSAVLAVAVLGAEALGLLVWTRRHEQQAAPIAS